MADVEVSPDLAKSLIEAQFPQLAPAEVEPLAEGWDNAVYRVNGTHVFRFPRRQIAVGLNELEARVLPEIAPRLPLPISVPNFVGRPQGTYPWPFSGYPFLTGETAYAARVTHTQRVAAAEPLARFLKALHRVPADTVKRLRLPPDLLARLDLRKRRPMVEARLRQAVQKGLLDDDAPFIPIIDAAPAGPALGRGVLVHGDFHVGNLLVDEAHLPSAVIDWGDVHWGHPAVDLAIAPGFLPPEGRSRFWRVYGAVDEDTRKMARFRALWMAILLLNYGHDIGNEALAVEAHAELALIRQP